MLANQTSDPRSAFNAQATPSRSAEVNAKPSRFGEASYNCQDRADNLHKRLGALLDRLRPVWIDSPRPTGPQSPETAARECDAVEAVHSVSKTLDLCHEVVAAIENGLQI